MTQGAARARGCGREHTGVVTARSAPVVAWSPVAALQARRHGSGGYSASGPFSACQARSPIVGCYGAAGPRQGGGGEVASDVPAAMGSHDGRQ
jgi:hypothetical protein